MILFIQLSNCVPQNIFLMAQENVIKYIVICHSVSQYLVHQSYKWHLSLKACLANTVKLECTKYMKVCLLTGDVVTHL